MEDLDLFYLHIEDGYSFRNCIGLIKNETLNINFEFQPEKIEVTFTNNSNTSLHRVTFNCKNFLCYRYGFQDENNNLLAKSNCIVEGKNLYNSMRNLGRRDAVVLYLKNNSINLVLRPLKNSGKENQTSLQHFITVLNEESKKYNLDGVSYREMANISIPIKIFTEICNQTNTTKCEFLHIIGFDQGVVFEGVSHDKKVEFSSRSSSLYYSSEYKQSQEKEVFHKKNKVVEASIPIATVRSLAKIHNISGQSNIIKFFFEEETPIKMVFTISSYGEYEIYFKDPENHD